VARLPLVHGLGPVAVEQARERAVGKQAAAGLAARAVVGLVVGADDALHCRVSIVEEGGSAEDRCSVNRAFMKPLCGLDAVTAVDGAAAGEAFCAALVVSLRAASRPGAQPSLPSAAELEEILAR
jgi:hypothetical protein